MNGMNSCRNATCTSIVEPLWQRGSRIWTHQSSVLGDVLQ